MQNDVCKDCIYRALADRYGAENIAMEMHIEKLKKLLLNLTQERHVPAARAIKAKNEADARHHDDYMALLVERDAAWNDAIEAAARIADPHSDRTAEKIRALRRPTNKED